MKILIRADGGVGIGLGHVMRTLVLAQNLSKSSEIVYVCKKGQDYKKGIDTIRAKGFAIIEIENDIINELKGIKGDCLITDSYDVDDTYFSETKKIFPITGYIDDLNIQPSYNVDFLINQNIYAKDLNYDINDGTKLLLGVQYTLLREEFLDIPERKIKLNIRDIMITLGGADPHNITKHIVEHISKCYKNLNLHIVVGPSFTHHNSLEEMKNDRVILYTNPKMSELMLKCDIAISACGSTLYELAACGTPTIGIVTAENQRIAAKKLDELGIIIYSNSLDNISNCIDRLDYQKRVTMSNKSQNIVDGLGGQRLANEIKDLILDRLS